MSDIAELIAGEPRRIIRSLSALLDLHADAEQQIWYPAAFRSRPDGAGETQTAIAILDDLRAAVAEVRVHDAGSAAWWYAVNAARQERDSRV